MNMIFQPYNSSNPQCRQPMQATRMAVQTLPYVAQSPGRSECLYTEPEIVGTCRWEEDEVNRRLDFKMTDAFKRMWDVHQLQKLPLRTAAYVLAMRSVVQATMTRGFD